MKEKFLKNSDLKILEERVHQFERDTGVELLMIVAESSDPYPAASLRLSIILSFLVMAVTAHYSTLNNTFTVYSFIAFFILFLPLGRINKLKKFALSSVEVDREVREKGLELFYNKAISRATETPTILLYASLLEKKFEVIAHENINTLVPENTWDQVVYKAIPSFANKNIMDAFLKATDVVEKIVNEYGSEFKQSKLNERHADALIWISDK